MKIICDRAALLEAVNLVAAVVPARSPSPALSCLKLSAARAAGAGTLTVSGTDAEVSLEVSLSQVDLQQPGVAVVSAEKIRQILQTVGETDPTVQVEVEGDSCQIRSTKSRFRIFVFPSGDFPPLPDYARVRASGPGGGGAGGSGGGEVRALFTHPAGSLLKLVHRTAFATARETSRYAINGVLFRRDGRRLEMVATDGRRLALCRTSIKGSDVGAGGPGGGGGGGGSGAVQCIVPTKALNLLTRLAGDPEEPVRIAVTDNRVYFGFDDGEGSQEGGHPRAVLSSALVEGAFPPYEDVIPKENDKKASAGREDLAAAVRQAAVLTNEESRGVRMHFSGKGKRVKLSSRAPEMGDSEIDLGLTEYAGEDLEICFNPHYLTDVLKTLDEDEVIVELKASNKPGLIRVGTDFLYVLMPVNLPA